jgi:hypothetical protein
MIISKEDLDQMVRTAEEIEKGKDCICCGHSFTPMDQTDKFCKKCIRNLYHELIYDMTTMFGSLEDKWKLKDGFEKVKRHKEISGMVKND